MDTHLSDENVRSCIDRFRSCCVHDNLEEPSDLLHDHLHDSQMVENGDAAAEEDDCRKNLNKHTPVADAFVKLSELIGQFSCRKSEEMITEILAKHEFWSCVGEGEKDGDSISEPLKDVVTNIPTKNEKSKHKLKTQTP